MRGFVVELLEPLLARRRRRRRARAHVPAARPRRLRAAERAGRGLAPRQALLRRGVRERGPSRATIRTRTARPTSSSTSTRASSSARGRREPRDPAADMASTLLQAEKDGEPLDEDTIVGMLRLMLSAGHDSTTSALGTAIMQVARDAGIQQRLRRRPHPRSHPPSTSSSGSRRPSWRCRATPCATSSCTGERCAPENASSSSGRRQIAIQRRSPIPTTCVVERAPNKHLVFGVGIHKCIGMPLAVLELRVVLEELLVRTQWISLAGPVVRTSWPRWGVSSLPLEVAVAREAA